GFQVSGPVVLPKVLDGRNQLFFMAAYEGLQERSSGADAAILPTEAMRNGDFSNFRDKIGNLITLYDPLTPHSVNGHLVREPSTGNRIPANRISPVARNVLTFVPRPNFGSGVYGENNYQAFNGAKNDYNQMMFRLDYAINSRNNVYVRHGRLPFTEYAGILF